MPPRWGAGSMSVQDFIRAELAISVQAILISLLLKNPLDVVFGFVRNVFWIIVNALGFHHITLTAPIVRDSEPDVEALLMDFVLHGTRSTWTSMREGQSVREGWILGRRACGDLTIETTRSRHKFEGVVFPWAVRAFRELAHNGWASKQAEDAVTKDRHCIRWIREQGSCTNDLWINRLQIPRHMIGTQKRVVDYVVQEFNFIKTRPSLRGAHYMTVLLSGPIGSGKTSFVQHVTAALNGFLVSALDLDNHLLRVTIPLVRRFAGGSTATHNLMHSNWYVNRKLPLKAFDRPIIILLDEWDSILEEHLPQEKESDQLTYAERKIRSKKRNKHYINEFLDSLTKMDNVITFFVTNCSIADINPCFVRDGRITHRIAMPSMTRDDVLQYVYDVMPEMGWPDVETPTLAVKAFDLALPQNLLPPLATMVQTLDLSKSMQDAIANLETCSRGNKRKTRAKAKSKLKLKQDELQVVKPMMTRSSSRMSLRGECLDNDS